MNNVESVICECNAVNYSKFVEPESNEIIWDKLTLRYVTENIDKVKSQVKLKSAGLNKAQTDDIFSNLIFYLAGAEDYDPTKENACKSIENYVSIGINYVVQRYRSELGKELKHIERNSILKDDDGEERSVMDYIPDTKSLDTVYEKDFDLERALDAIEGIRYINNFDIYSMIYIRLLSNDEDYEKNLMAIGLDKKGLGEIYKEIKRVEELRELLKAITLTSKERAIKELEKYVYGYKFIKEAIV